MKCKDFHTLVEEGLKGESLSIAAQEHAGGCRPCREFNQKHVELREWLTVCEQINAPKDFQFGVQRKIANSRASHTSNGFLQSLKYIIPAIGMAAILFLVLNYSLNNNQGKPTGETTAAVNANVAKPQENPAVAQSNPQAEQPAPSSNQEIAQAPVANKVANKQDNSARIAIPKDSTNDNGGSTSDKENALKDSSSKLPPGLNLSRSAAQQQSDTMNALRNVGILTNTKMTVILVRTEAAGSGVQKGDVVQSFDGKTVTVSRNGQTVHLSVN